MPLVRSPAVILQVFPYGETSKILRILTPELGLRSVIARGAQRPRSSFGGVLEPFTEGEAHFHLRDGRDLHTLSGFDLVRGRQALGRNLTAFAAASLIAELVIRSGTEEPQPELYTALLDGLERLAMVPADVATSEALAAVWEMIAHLGYMPELEVCVRCGRPLASGEASRFDVEAGGAACMVCRPTGRVVDAATRRELVGLCAGEPPPPALVDPSLHRALLRAFVPAHLAHGAPLRSLPLLLEQLT
jgi:DNA repair protein RecO (recombination protein O)